MLRTTVYLDDETVWALRRLSEAEKRSQAEIIREALRSYVGRTGNRRSLSEMPGLGAYDSGRSDLSEKVEDILREAAHKREWG